MPVKEQERKQPWQHFNLLESMRLRAASLSADKQPDAQCISGTLACSAALTTRVIGLQQLPSSNSSAQQVPITVGLSPKADCPVSSESLNNPFVVEQRCQSVTAGKEQQTLPLQSGIAAGKTVTEGSSRKECSKDQRRRNTLAHSVEALAVEAKHDDRTGNQELGMATKDNPRQEASQPIAQVTVNLQLPHSCLANSPAESNAEVYHCSDRDQSEPEDVPVPPGKTSADNVGSIATLLQEDPQLLTIWTEEDAELLLAETANVQSQLEFQQSQPSLEMSKLSINKQKQPRRSVSVHNHAQDSDPDPTRETHSQLWSRGSENATALQERAAGSNSNALEEHPSTAVRSGGSQHIFDCASARLPFSFQRQAVLTKPMDYKRLLAGCVYTRPRPASQIPVRNAPLYGHFRATTERQRQVQHKTRQAHQAFPGLQFASSQPSCHGVPVFDCAAGLACRPLQTENNAYSQGSEGVAQDSNMYARPDLISQSAHLLPSKSVYTGRPSQALVYSSRLLTAPSPYSVSPQPSRQYEFAGKAVCAGQELLSRAAADFAFDSRPPKRKHRAAPKPDILSEWGTAIIQQPHIESVLSSSSELHDISSSLPSQSQNRNRHPAEEPFATLVDVGVECKKNARRIVAASEIEPAWICKERDPRLAHGRAELLPHEPNPKRRKPYLQAAGEVHRREGQTPLETECSETSRSEDSSEQTVGPAEVGPSPGVSSHLDDPGAEADKGCAQQSSKEGEIPKDADCSRARSWAKHAKRQKSPPLLLSREHAPSAAYLATMSNFKTMRLGLDVASTRQVHISNLHVAWKQSLLKMHRFVVRRSRIAGQGVYCTEDIEVGELLMEYVGEVVRRTIADVREKEGASEGIYFFALGKDLVVDASHAGGIARYINHCCSPNCSAKKVEADGKMRIFVLAAQKIRAGEELTYDYCLSDADGLDGQPKIACHCSAPKCRKYL